MPADDERREQGVGFGPLADDLEDAQYPLEKTELLDAFGDRTVGLQDGEETLQGILGPLGDVTFDSAEEVRQEVIGMVGDQAIGRKNYTDRGGVTSEDDSRNGDPEDANQSQESI